MIFGGSRSQTRPSAMAICRAMVRRHSSRGRVMRTAIGEGEDHDPQEGQEDYHRCEGGPEAVRGHCIVSPSRWALAMFIRTVSQNSVRAWSRDMSSLLLEHWSQRLT